MEYSSLRCRAVQFADAEVISRIYNHYIDQTVITFEEAPVSTNEIAQRIEKVVSHGLPWFVSELDGQVIGYAYAAPWRERSAYRYSVEVSVYLKHDVTVQGAGSLLYRALFDALENSEVHVALAGIALPNARSIALHEKFGMKKVAHLEQVGYKFGRWIDVAYWQRMF